MNAEIFDVAEVDCTQSHIYIMAPDTFTSEQAVETLQQDIIVEKVVFQPVTSQMRISYHPRGAIGHQEIFNVQSPSITFLRRLYELDNTQLSTAVRDYMIHSDIRAQFIEGRHERTADGYKMVALSEDERIWLMSIVMGSRHD